MFLTDTHARTCTHERANAEGDIQHHEPPPFHFVMGVCLVCVRMRVKASRIMYTYVRHERVCAGVWAIAHAYEGAYAFEY